jgi:hypothetical protein
MAGIAQSIWNISGKQQKALTANMTMASTKHGIVSQIPLICKGPTCPYRETCSIPDADLDIMGRCVIEISTLISRFERYCEEFQITDADVVDLGQVKHLVDIEIKLLRCNQAMASSPQLVDDVVTAVQRGQKYTKKEINPITQYEIQLLNSHSKILKDLAATRDAKKLHNNANSSQQAADLIARAAKVKGGLKGVVAPVNQSGFLYIDAEVVEEKDVTAAEQE